MDAENDSTNRVRAKKESWKTVDMPEDKVILPINKKYSKEEYNKLKQGFIPKVMEEKWFIYFEEQKLYFHRSWTGLCVYELNFIKDNGKYIISKGYLNGKIAEQRDSMSLKEEVNIVLSLIYILLLNEDDPHTDLGMSFV